MATITSPRTASPAPSSTNTPQITTSSPSSSTRTSLEQTRPIASSASVNASGGPANPSQRRNRAALRDYYNLKAKPSNAVGNLQLQRTGSIASTHSDASIATNTTLTTTTLNESPVTTSAATAQLDDPEFKAEEWVADLLEKSSLRDILKTEATLVSEIRNLDGERKALVYDNYSKLIKAVGTIGEMQRSMNGPSEAVGGVVMKGVGGLGGNPSVGRGGLERVDELEVKMDGLRTTVRELAGGVKSDDKLREARFRRREEKELEKNKKDLVRWILNAPKRLSTLIAAEKEEEAEKEWVIVKGYLDKWQGVKGVDEVRKACEDILAGSEEEEVVDKSKPGPG